MSKEINKMLSRINGQKRFTIIMVIISIMIFGITLGGVILFTTGNQQEYIITDVYIQTELNSESTNNGYKTTTKYLYFCTTDSGEEIVFENEDNIFFFKFNSSDILAKMRKYEQSKEPFKIRSAGFRIGVFSTYQNIIEVCDYKGDTKWW